MSQTLLEMTKDLVLAQIQAYSLPPEEMHISLRDIHNCLLGLHAKEASQGVEALETPSKQPISNWKTSITKHFVRCLICGAIFRQLSVKHLRSHGLDTRSYRFRFGIPSRQPLAAHSVTALRKQNAQQWRPWEKAPMYQKAHQKVQQPIVKKAGQVARKRTS